MRNSDLCPEFAVILNDEELLGEETVIAVRATNGKHRGRVFREDFFKPTPDGKGHAYKRVVMDLKLVFDAMQAKIKEQQYINEGIIEDEMNSKIKDYTSKGIVFLRNSDSDKLPWDVTNFVILKDKEIRVNENGERETVIAIKSMADGFCGARKFFFKPCDKELAYKRVVLELSYVACEMHRDCMYRYDYPEYP